MRPSQFAFLLSVFGLDAVPAQIPLRTTTQPIGTRWQELKSLTSIRVLSGGRVQVRDSAARRVVIFDSTLTQFTEVRDTAGTPPVVYVGLRSRTADSAPLFRRSPVAGRVDTIAMLGVPAIRTVSKVVDSGETRSTQSATWTSPVPSSDDWTVLPDGTIAIVRARDYHIDWVHADGTITATPAMPFDRMPDYPPVVRGQVLADLDGNVWILTHKPALPSIGPIFDVVNRKGEIVERVQLPSERELIGFGPGGVVYMRFHPGVERVRLEWVRVVR